MRAAGSPCQFQTAPQPVSVALCETFDQPAGTGNRSGQLNGSLWGVSRVTGNMNFSAPADGWSPTSEQQCGQTVTVQPEHDLAICNGQLVEATNDGGTVTTLAMYPKQPFDIAGRTGTVSFDVSDDAQGTHAAWPEFWYTDQPVPAPFTHESSWVSLPRNGLGVRFAAACDAGQGANCGTNCPGTNAAPVVTVDSAVVVNNYVGNDSFSGGSLKVTQLNCVVESSGPGSMNHFELRIGQNEVDVYGTDAGTTSPLKELATISGDPLSLTRGLIWLEDVHYNANKMGTQGTHTFTWDNVGFDGPVLARDLAFDVLDNLSTTNSDGSLNLGWFIGPSSSQTLTTLPMTASNIAAASGALVTFNFWSEAAPLPLSVQVNGHPLSVSWPYPDTTSFTTRTLAVPVPLSDLVAGANAVTFSTGSNPMTVFNVDLILQGAAGVPGGGSGPTPTPPPTVTGTATRPPTPPPTQTITPTPSPTSTGAATFTTTATSNPVSLTSGATETVSVKVVSSAATNALVDVEIYNAAGSKVAQQWFDNQAFVAGTGRTYKMVYVPGPTGTYTVKVGVYTVGWGTLRSWNNGASAFTVTQ